MKRFTTLAALAATTLLATSALADSVWLTPATPAPTPEVQAPEVEQNLKVFDTLDFDVFSNQKCDRLNESRADDLSLPGRMALKPRASNNISPI